MRLLPRPAGTITSGRILFTQAVGDEGGGGNDLQRHPPRHALGVVLPRDSLQQDLLTLSAREMCRIRGNRIAMIFQEPFASLHPVFTVGAQIVEAIELHRPLRGKAARAVAVEMMHQVGIPDATERFRDYPHQMSGGMLQRVMIAMALSCRPSLLIADEPTTALDVTTQSQILELLRTLSRPERDGESAHEEKGGTHHTEHRKNGRVGRVSQRREDGHAHSTDRESSSYALQPARAALYST